MKKQSDATSIKESLKLTQRAIKDINKYAPNVLLSIVIDAVFQALVPYVTVYFSARLINELAGLRRADVVWKWVVITVCVTAFVSLLGYIFERWTKAMQAKYYPWINRIIPDKLMGLDYADYDSQSTHDLINQIMQNHGWKRWGYRTIVDGIRDGTKAGVGILGAIALTISLFALPVPESAGMLTVLNSPYFILVFVLLIGAITAFSSVCQNNLTKAIAKGAEFSTYNNRIIGFFGFLPRDSARALDIRMYNQQKICDYYATHYGMEQLAEYNAKLFKSLPGILSAVSGACGAVLTGVAYAFVCLKAWGGAFGVGSVTQYVSAITALTGNVSVFLNSLGLLHNNAPFLRINYKFHDIPNKMYQGSLTTEKRSDRQYDVEFRDVSFKYPGSEIWALRHVNMKFKVGKRLAIVGENGSGKTTFIKLLCRLYDPQEGQILLNGIDIRKYRYDDYMNIFSVVFQDFQLISQPLGNNVAGSSEYDRERARKALIDAGFGDRLDSLPDGLDTQLYKDFGKDGVDISGGEAQKIAIARALYKDAPFIILDEPTAALDPMAEAEIYAKFNDISGDKTAIYISHRLSSCKFCDEIAVFHEGAVIQQGTHEDLLANTSGKYHELWNAQAQYYTKQ